jgi:hypothetical protein
MEAQTLVAFNGGLITVGLRHTAEVVSPRSWLKMRCGWLTLSDGCALVTRNEALGTMVPSYDVCRYDLRLQRAGLWSAEV